MTSLPFRLDRAAPVTLRRLASPLRFRPRLPRRRQLALADARIIHFSLLSERQGEEEYFRPVALYGFVADQRWVSGMYRGERIHHLRRAEIGTRYEVTLRPGARIPVRYRVAEPQISALVVGDAKRRQTAHWWRRATQRR